MQTLLFPVCRDHPFVAEKIEVQKPEKVLGTQTKKQTPAIRRNFIAAADIPEEKA